MCLIAFAWRSHRRYPLVLIANRDEFHFRPAAADFDPEAAEIYGGRDLVQGGGWLQVSTRGRLAAVTNVRAGLNAEEKPRSRGWLVRDFVRGASGAVGFAAALGQTASKHGRFNLLLWDGTALAFASNHPRPTHSIVSPGLHAMSNGALDAPWPKSGHATRALQAWLASARNPARTRLIKPRWLRCSAHWPTPRPHPTHFCPTPASARRSNATLSPPFVSGERYGTRCSSVVLIGYDHLVFAERRFGPNAVAAGESFVTLPFLRVSC